MFELLRKILRFFRNFWKTYVQSDVTPSNVWINTRVVTPKILLGTHYYKGYYTLGNKEYDTPMFSITIRKYPQKCTGHGRDNRGVYELYGVCKGTYLALTKRYYTGTGSNFGEKIYLRLRYFDEKIMGGWWLRTLRNCEEGTIGWYPSTNFDPNCDIVFSTI